MHILEVQQLTKRYGQRIGVQDISLSVAAGEIFGFLGPNGAGKTTVIRVLMGFLRAHSGSARILGHDCWQDTARIKQEVGYLPGDLRLYPWMTTRRALKIISQVRRRELSNAGRDLADRFSLELDLRVSKMSRGTRQKLGIVLALIHKPKVLILDEPTSGLDPLVQEVLYQQLRELAHNGHTVFFSSHTLSEVEQLCDRVAIVRRGQLVADETLDSLCKRASRVVTLTYSDANIASQIELPACLSRIQRREHQIFCDLEGSASQLLQWAAGQPLADLSITPPNLESLFRKYYEPSQESPT